MTQTPPGHELASYAREVADEAERLLSQHGTREELAVQLAMASINLRAADSLIAQSEATITAQWRKLEELLALYAEMGGNASEHLRQATAMGVCAADLFREAADRRTVRARQTKAAADARHAGNAKARQEVIAEWQKDGHVYRGNADFARVKARDLLTARGIEVTPRTIAEDWLPK